MEKMMEVRFTSGKTLQVTKGIADLIKQQLQAGSIDWQTYEDNVNPGTGVFLMINMRNVDCIVDKEIMSRLAIKKVPGSNGLEKKDK